MSIRFRTQVRADRLNESIVSSLVEAGWFSTAVGIENGSRSALRRMGKQASLEDNYRCIQLLEKYNVYAVINMILFDPETSLGELEENLLFLDSLSWGVTKGIFSEMFAAEGTPFTEKLRKTELLNGDSIHMNQQYYIKDRKVLNVYRELKRWASNHRIVFDRVINPIAAPKVLPTNGYREYYNLARLLYALDLQLFRELVKNPNQTSVFSEALEADVQGQYLAVSKMADDLDRMYGLSYKLGNNVFLKK